MDKLDLKLEILNQQKAELESKIRRLQKQISDIELKSVRIQDYKSKKSVSKESDNYSGLSQSRSFN